MTAATVVRERPILFSGAMVRAILDGDKTQTRRVVKPPPPADVTDIIAAGNGFVAAYPNRSATRPFVYRRGPSPYGAPGDRLWVRETAWYDRSVIPSLGSLRCFFEGRDMRRENANGGETGQQPHTSTAPILDCNGYLVKRPSIHMPRWASRLTLEVAEVRVERVQEISAADAVAEGGVRDILFNHGNPLREAAFARGKLGPDGPDHEQRYAGSVEAFAALWDSLNAKRGYGWDANPWVWVISFNRMPHA